jgi:hypothetical protein
VREGSLTINRWLAPVLFSAAALVVSTSTSAFAWPCPVDFIASIDDDNNGFVTMISKRKYRFVPPDESGFTPDSPNPKHLPVDPRSFWDDLSPYIFLGQQVAICSDRQMILLGDTRSPEEKHKHALIERVP